MAKGLPMTYPKIGVNLLKIIEALALIMLVPKATTLQREKKRILTDMQRNEAVCPNKLLHFSKIKSFFRIWKRQSSRCNASKRKIKSWKRSSGVS